MRQKPRPLWISDEFHPSTMQKPRPYHPTPYHPTPSRGEIEARGFGWDSSPFLWALQQMQRQARARWKNQIYDKEQSLQSLANSGGFISNKLCTNSWKRALLPLTGTLHCSFQALSSLLITLRLCSYSLHWGIGCVFEIRNRLCLEAFWTTMVYALLVARNFLERYQGWVLEDESLGILTNYAQKLTSRAPMCNFLSRWSQCSGRTGG